jgi:DNA topoisomerase-1
MKESFSDIVDYKFTANMENKLDDIEKGGATTEKVLSDFWKEFSKELTDAEANGGEHMAIPAEETDIICEKCGAKMVVRSGKFGKFAACPNYPKCRNTKPLASEAKPEKEETSETKPEKKKAEPQKTDKKCEICGAELVIRNGRYGSFYACSNFPSCHYTKPIEETPGNCPICDAKLVKRHGRNHSTFYGCQNYPQCEFSTWDIPTEEKCPTCGKTLFAKKGKKQLVCLGQGCGFEKEAAAEGNKEE